MNNPQDFPTPDGQAEVPPPQGPVDFPNPDVDPDIPPPGDDSNG